MTTIGLIGARHIGSTVARAFADHGYDVVLINSRGPETLAGLVADLGPGARAAAAAAADIAVVTIPLKAIDAVPVEPLAGKIVIDTNKYCPQRDGHIAALDAKTTTTSEIVQAHLPGSRVGKAFDHTMLSDILADASPTGTPGRHGLAVVSNDEDAAATVAGIVGEFGFDRVIVTPLSEG